MFNLSLSQLSAAALERARAERGPLLVERYSLVWAAGNGGRDGVQENGEKKRGKMVGRQLRRRKVTNSLSSTSKIQQIYFC